MANEPFKYLKCFCTGGKGTEKFIASEVKQTLMARKVNTIQGKVFFDSTLAAKFPEKLLELRTVERVFLRVYHVQGLERLLDKDGNVSTTIVKHFIQRITTWESFLYYFHKANGRQSNIKETDVKVGAAEDQEPPTKKQRTNSQDPLSGSCTLRLSCKCSGKPSKVFAEQSMMKSLGYVISNVTKWKVDLRHPDVEIYLQLNNEGLVLGIPLTKTPLSHRSYMKTIGLRSTIAHIMAKLSLENLKVDQKAAVRLLDPMCGAGTIVVEAARMNERILCIGIDKDERQVGKAAENVKFADVSSRVEIIQGDVRALPLPSSSIDCVVCDTPFGINHGTVDEILQLYPEMFKSMDRILRPGGSCILLTSSTLKNRLVDSASQSYCQLSSPTTGTDPVSSMNEGHSAAPSCDVVDVTYTTYDTTKKCGSQYDKNSTPNNVSADLAEKQRIPLIYKEKCELDKTQDDSVFSEETELAVALKHDNVTYNTDNVGNVLYDSTGGDVCVAWTVINKHPVRLGETEAFICEFRKDK